MNPFNTKFTNLKQINAIFSLPLSLIIKVVNPYYLSSTFFLLSPLITDNVFHKNIEIMSRNSIVMKEIKGITSLKIKLFDIKAVNVEKIQKDERNKINLETKM